MPLTVPLSTVVGSSQAVAKLSAPFEAIQLPRVALESGLGRHPVGFAGPGSLAALRQPVGLEAPLHHHLHAEAAPGGELDGEQAAEDAAARLGDDVRDSPEPRRNSDEVPAAPSHA